MKAIGFYQPGPIDAPDSLIELEVPAPELRPRDLLVRVQAVSVNPVDMKLRKSARPPEGQARVLGFDAVGTVVSAGAEASLFRPGDMVFYAGAIDRPGANAEYQAVDERIVGRKPKSLSALEAAALPLTSLTAWELLFDRLRVPYGVKSGGGSILIIGGAGGVGSILTQIARQLTGLTVIATASRPETADWCRRMGAHHVIDHSRPLGEELAAIGIPQVTYVASLTQTDRYLPVIVDILQPQGALALIDDPVSLDVLPFKRKSLSVHWELMFTRSLFATPDMIRQSQILNEVSALTDSGVLRTTMTQELGPMRADTLKAAHRLAESGRAIGKVVLGGIG